MSESTRPCVLKLTCSVQNYAWGKIGLDSKVAQLKSDGDSQFIVDSGQSYAELWMGVHPKAPSTISYPHSVDGVVLGEWLSTNEWALGKSVNKQFNGQLPFLFKVLSINKALSIQAHPDKHMACRLNAMHPDRYPDPNHKPEMVIALSDFKGLCGFRPYEDIKKFILGIAELRNVLSAKSVLCVSDDEISPEEAIKMCFSDLMNQQDDIISNQLKKLIDKFKKDWQERLISELGDSSELRNNNESLAIACKMYVDPSALAKTYLNCLLKPDAVNGVILTNEEMELLYKLYSWFPNDVGCFCLFFLNVVSLSPGQSMFLGPNVPHAYISGDVIECMANSDNVVRAGLTPKFRDKETLCEILLYSPKSSHDQLFQPKPHPQLADEISLYNPPTPEFVIAKIEIKKEISIPAINGPSILLVIKGFGSISVSGSTGDIGDEVPYEQGEVLFIPAMNIITVSPTSYTQIFQAFCEL